MDTTRVAAFSGFPVRTRGIHPKASPSVQFAGRLGEGGDDFRFSPLRSMRVVCEANEEILRDLRDEFYASQPSARRLSDIAKMLDKLAEKLYDQPDFTDRELKHESSKQQILAAMMESIAEDIRSEAPGSQILWRIEDVVGPPPPQGPKPKMLLNTTEEILQARIQSNRSILTGLKPVLSSKVAGRKERVRLSDWLMMQATEISKQVPAGAGSATDLNTRLSQLGEHLSTVAGKLRDENCANADIIRYIEQAVGPEAPPKKPLFGSASPNPAAEGRSEGDAAFWEMIGESFGQDPITHDPNLDELEAGLGLGDSRKMPLVAGMKELEEVADRVAMAQLSGEGMSVGQRRELGNKLILAGVAIEDYALDDESQPERFKWDDKYRDLGWYMKTFGQDLENPEYALADLNQRLSLFIPKRKGDWKIKTFEES